MSIRAAHRGFCVDCEGPVLPGDVIVMTADLDWVHEECPDELPLPSAERPACPACNLVHAGECW